MKHVLALVIFTLIIFTSCDNNSNSGTANKDSADMTTGDAEPQDDVLQVAGCYMRVSGRDTLVVRLNQSGKEINGRIYFDNYQMDGSSGTATGNITKDTIHLFYSFHSEGMSSVMEMYFQVNDSQLIRGIGDMDVKGDTAYFTSVASVTFPGKEKLDKIACSDLHIKFND